jgi:guanylate kinase
MFTTAFSGSLFVVAAPSGAGKSTLVNALLALEPGIKLSISTTTRPPRPGEEDGREYHFTTAEDFVARPTAANSWNGPRCMAITTARAA